jgi:hypothetical protein
MKYPYSANVKKEIGMIAGERCAARLAGMMLGTGQQSTRTLLSAVLFTEHLM